MPPLPDPLRSPPPVLRARDLPAWSLPCAPCSGRARSSTPRPTGASRPAPAPPFPASRSRSGGARASPPSRAANARDVAVLERVRVLRREQLIHSCASARARRSSRARRAGSRVSICLMKSFASSEILSQYLGLKWRSHLRILVKSWCTSLAWNGAYPPSRMNVMTPTLHTSTRWLNGRPSSTARGVGRRTKRGTHGATRGLFTPEPTPRARARLRARYTSASPHTSVSSCSDDSSFAKPKSAIMSFESSDSLAYSTCERAHGNVPMICRHAGSRARAAALASRARARHSAVEVAVHDVVRVEEGDAVEDLVHGLARARL